MQSLRGSLTGPARRATRPLLRLLTAQPILHRGEAAVPARWDVTMHVAGVKFDAGRASTFWLEVGMLTSTRTEPSVGFNSAVHFDPLLGSNEVGAQVCCGLQSCK